MTSFTPNPNPSPGHSRKGRGVLWNPTPTLLPTRAQPSGIIIAMGSNLGDPHWGDPVTIVATCLRLMPSYGLTVVRHSRLLVTAHVPDPKLDNPDHTADTNPDPANAFPDYHNAVVEVMTELSAADLLTLLHEIERDFGRTRPGFHAPRTLDLDLLVFDGQVSAPGVWPILPHPALYERPFIQTLLQDMMASETKIGQDVGSAASEQLDWREVT